MPIPRQLLAAVTLLAVGATATPAEAGRTCPWGPGEPTVTISGNHVVVDGVEYRAKGFGRSRLERDMRACGATMQADRHLDTWRRKRRNAWLTGAGGLFLWPLWIVTGVQIHGAVKHKKGLETALEGHASRLPEA